MDVEHGTRLHTYLSGQRYLVDVPITSSTEQEVLAGVHGHGHDLHIEQDRQEHFT